MRLMRTGWAGDVMAENLLQCLHDLTLEDRRAIAYSMLNHGPKEGPLTNPPTTNSPAK